MKLRKLPIYETDANGGKSKRLSAKWYAVFVDHAGALRRLPLLEDRRASDTIARAVDRLNALRSSNESVLPPEVCRAVEAMPAAIVKSLAAWDLLGTARVAASKPLVEHVADFKAAILSRGNTAKYAEMTANRVLSIFTTCGFKAISDVSASKVQNHVASLRKDTADAKGNGRRGSSAATSNYILRDAKAFFRWMVQDRRCHESPLAHLTGVNTRTDRRHDRRALSTDELRWLLDTAANGPARLGMNGADRVMLYRLAVESGLRAGELRSLTRASFDLSGDEPSVTIAAAYAKNRRTDTLPLRPGTAAALTVHLAGKMPTATAFTMPAPGHLVDMFRGDLADARQAWLDSLREVRQRTEAATGTFLCPVDEAGRYVDFHALRHTFISNLAGGGVHPKTAQTLARHSTISLTMDRYTHMRREDLAGALDALPDLSGPLRQVDVATGTDGKAAAAFVSPSVSLNGDMGRNLVALGAIKSAVVGDTGMTENRGKTAVFPMETAKAGVGFEPTNNGFAIRPLRPLGHPADIEFNTAAAKLQERRKTSKTTNHTRP